MNKLLASLSVFLSVLSGQLSFMSDPPTRPRWSLEANCSRHVRLFRVPACPPARLPDRRKERERERENDATNFSDCIVSRRLPGGKKADIHPDFQTTHSLRTGEGATPPAHSPARNNWLRSLRTAFGRSHSPFLPLLPSFLLSPSLFPVGKNGWE